MKVIIFGIGKIYNKIKHYFHNEKTEVIALVDNRWDTFETPVDGYTVDAPEHIGRYPYDYIVITSGYDIAIKRQLLKLGICLDKIVHYRNYIGALPAKIPAVQRGISALDMLILSNDFGYHGGAIACMNLARVLRQGGYRVTIAVPTAERELLEETLWEEGIQVIVVDNLTYMGGGNLKWMSEYACVFANTFVMAACAVKLARKKKVYLWLHESIDTYMSYEYWHDEIADGLESDRLVIGAVSEVARENFQSIFGKKKEIGLLPYGIADEYEGNHFCAENARITFTVVANHGELKGVDVLLDAFSYIPEALRKQCRFLFAGKTYDDAYGRLIRERIGKNAACSYLGELSRKKLYALYAETDVVIVPSRRDSLPLVATEAMMLKIPCIISDATGTAAFIRHQYNGLIFKSEDRRELAGAVCWCLENRERLRLLAENARKTYEEWFSMEKFCGRVMKALELLRD